MVVTAAIAVTVQLWRATPEDLNICEIEGMREAAKENFTLISVLVSIAFSCICTFRIQIFIQLSL